MKKQDRNIIIILVAVLVLALVGVFYVKGPTLSISGTGCSTTNLPSDYEFTYFCSGGIIKAQECGNMRTIGDCDSGEVCLESSWGTFTSQKYFVEVERNMCGLDTCSDYKYTCENSEITQNKCGVVTSYTSCNSGQVCKQSNFNSYSSVIPLKLRDNLCKADVVVNPDTCIDSDNGKDTSKLGYVRGVELGEEYNFDDECRDSTTVTEWYCDSNNKPNWADITTSGMKCTAGLLIADIKPECYSNTDCKDHECGVCTSGKCTYLTTCKKGCYADTDCLPNQKCTSGTCLNVQPECTKDIDCAQIACFAAPCPVNKCVNNKCTIVAEPKKVECKEYQELKNNVCEFSYEKFKTSDGMKDFFSTYMFETVFTIILFIIIIVIIVILLLPKNKTVIL